MNPPPVDNVLALPPASPPNADLLVSPGRVSPIGFSLSSPVCCSSANLPSPSPFNLLDTVSRPAWDVDDHDFVIGSRSAIQPTFPVQIDPGVWARVEDVTVGKFSSPSVIKFFYVGCWSEKECVSGFFGFVRCSGAVFVARDELTVLDAVHGFDQIAGGAGVGLGGGVSGNQTQNLTQMMTGACML